MRPEILVTIRIGITALLTLCLGFFLENRQTDEKRFSDLTIYQSSYMGRKFYQIGENWSRILIAGFFGIFGALFFTMMALSLISATNQAIMLQVSFTKGSGVSKLFILCKSSV